MSDEKPFVFSDLQEKWLQALESGEWKQCVGELASIKGGFCCLGVACVVAGKQPQKLCANRLGFTSDSGQHVYSVAPDDIVRDFHLRSEVGHTVIGRALAEINDEGKTFAEIAAFIRANPTAVFVEPSPCTT